MVHFSVRAAPGTLAFRTWEEARELWDRLSRAAPMDALTLMPAHVHSACEPEVVGQIKEALRGYALWRNHARGERGPVWEHGAEPTEVRGAEHEKRTMRYILLNPCRDHLVRDPLGWPFSTHRDAVGLAYPALVRPVRDARRWHAWVSGDPSVQVGGTQLPQWAPGREPTLAEIFAAVSALTRTPESQLRRPGPARDLLLQSARDLTGKSCREIARVFGLDPATVSRAGACPEGVPLVARVCGDPRFALLRDGPMPWK